MFDTQNNSGLEPPQNLPFQPDDILATTEKDSVQQTATPPDALEAGLLKKKTTPPPLTSSQVYTPPALPEQQSVSYDVKKPILGKIITIIVVLCIIGGLIFAGWWVYNTYFVTPSENTSKNLNPTTTDTNISPSTNETVVTPTTSNSENNNEILFGEQTDSDKDNLDDRREQELLTDSTKADTDDDGLNDGDEVLIWKTNPLKPDTDDDGYKDGEEVRNGYNPLGGGKLLGTLPVTSTVQTTSTL